MSLFRRRKSDTSNHLSGNPSNPEVTFLYGHSTARVVEVRIGERVSLPDGGVTEPVPYADDSTPSKKANGVARMKRWLGEAASLPEQRERSDVFAFYGPTHPDSISDRLAWELLDRLFGATAIRVTGTALDWERRDWGDW